MDQNTLCITYNGPINDQNVHNFMIQLNSELANTARQINKLYIPLNTQGGGVNAGIMLYNYLRSLQLPITTHNIGFVNSIGNVVFVAGDHRYAAPSTTFLFHGVQSPAYNPMSVVQMKENLSQVEQDEKRLAEIIENRSGYGPIQLKRLFNQGRSITLDEAKEHGLIDDIKDLIIPPVAHNVIGSLIQFQ